MKLINIPKGEYILNDYILVDMDGTLSDGSARLHFIESLPKDWDSFFAEGINDPLYPKIERLVRDAISENIDVVIFTARPFSNYDVTKKWLISKNIKYKSISMRNTGDRRPDYITKKDMLNRIIRKYDGKRPLYAIDDKHDVLEMFRKNNVQIIDAKKLNDS